MLFCFWGDPWGAYPPLPLPPPPPPPPPPLSALIPGRRAPQPGSSIQIAIFAVPLACLFGWAIGAPFSLSFDPLATVLLFVSVLHSTLVVDEPASHWLMGVQLLATYALVAAVYAFR